MRKKDRVVNIGRRNHTTVTAYEYSDSNGVSCKYGISRSHPVDGIAPVHCEFGFVRFQNDPIRESGVNGAHHEDLLAIVVDRLMSFQDGKFACRDNALAIQSLKQALFYLRRRTEDRQRRGVEGTSDI